MDKRFFAISTALGVTLGIFAAFCSYKWKISQDIPFSSDILKIQNPFLIEKEIKNCTILKGTVSNFILSENAITIKVKEAPSNWHFYAYLPKNQLREVELNQKVTVRGIFRVKLAETMKDGADIYIGSSINNPFYSSKAEIIEKVG